MRKIITAGVISLSFAAMPIFGALATEPLSPSAQDTLTVTVTESCTFTHKTGSSGSYTKALTAGTYDPSFATSTFVSSCNNGKGYDIAAEFTSLSHTGNAGEAITYSAETPSTNSGTWTATIGSSNIAASEGQLGTQPNQDPAGGTEYTVTYKVSLHDDQAQGTYTGTATYTLTQKN